jgi:hypothetical protein
MLTPSPENKSKAYSAARCSKPKPDHTEYGGIEIVAKDKLDFLVPKDDGFKEPNGRRVQNVCAAA